MNLEVKYAYVQKVTRTDNRLNLSLAETIKNKKGDKCYINYGLTLWDDVADKYESKLTVGDKKDIKSSCVFFNGYVTGVATSKPKTLEDKIYTTFYVNLNKGNNTFGIVGETPEVADETEEEDIFA